MADPSYELKVLWINDRYPVTLFSLENILKFKVTLLFMTPLDWSKARYALLSRHAKQVKERNLLLIIPTK